MNNYNDRHLQCLIKSCLPGVVKKVQDVPKQFKSKINKIDYILQRMRNEKT